MNKFVCLALIGPLLSACGGSSGKAFIGTAEVVVDETGAVQGVSGQSLNIIETDIGSFGHGFVKRVDAMAVGKSRAAPGDTANFVVSGIVEDYDVGAPYTGGTATYVGDYAMTVVTGYERSPNPDQWTEQQLSGQLIAEIALHTAVEAAADPDHGHSHDVDVVELSINADPLFIGEEGVDLVFDEVIIYEPDFPTPPDSDALHSFDGGYAHVGDGSPVPLQGQIAFGSEGMIATFHGRERDVLVAGGFGLENTDPTGFGPN